MPTSKMRTSSFDTFAVTSGSKPKRFSSIRIDWMISRRNPLEQREHAGAHAVPEIQHAVRLRAHEARAEHHVRLALHDRDEELREFVRVVFEVGVLHDHHVARSGADPGAKRRALALVVLVQDELVDLAAQLAVQAV